MRTVSFAVPLAAGAYAPEVLYLNVDNDVRSLPDLVNELTTYISALPAGATLEVDLLKTGGAPGTAGDWYLAAKSFNAAGLGTTTTLSGWRGVRLRAKSGGTAGTLTADVSWF